jgi:hypothetical protein
MWRPAFRFFSSLQLALVLLAVLIVACAIATWCEKQLNADVARAYVYGAAWFHAWLALLCLNLSCAALARYPWKRRHYGFVLTHFGIILILIGGWLDLRWGVEGMLELHRGAPPTDLLEFPGRQEVLVKLPPNEEPARTPFRIDVLARHPEQVFDAATPAPEVHVSVLATDYVTAVVQDVVAAEKGVPALRWSLRSEMADPSGTWMLLNDAYLFGPVRISLTRGQPPQAKPEDGKPVLTFYLGEDGRLRYYSFTRSAGLKQGEIQVGKAMPLGWMGGAEFVVDRLVPEGKPRMAWRPVNSEEGMGENIRGLRCRVRLREASEEVWLGPGPDTAAPDWQSLELGGRAVALAFTTQTAHLPFKVELLEFRAPYHEGTENFMAFESKLRFNQDPSTTRVILMNEPADFPDTWWGPWLGTSYKLSQANHHMPGDPDYSGVGVMLDPGWLPKWLGSLLLCVGLFVVFYLRPSGQLFTDLMAKAQEAPDSGASPAVARRETAP